MAHHHRGLSRPRLSLRRRVGADLHSDGRLVPLVSDSGGRDGRNSVLAGGHPAGARTAGRFLHRHLDDRVHGRGGHRRAHSIILVDFIELRLAEGMPLDQAVVDAGAVRFRPMLLTALAVVVGASVILADPIFQGLAISLMAGEIASLPHQPHGRPVLYFMAYSRKIQTCLSPQPAAPEILLCRKPRRANRSDFRIETRRQRTSYHVPFSRTPGCTGRRSSGRQIS